MLNLTLRDFAAAAQEVIGPPDRIAAGQGWFCKDISTNGVGSGGPRC